MATVEEEMLSGNVDSDEGDDESEEQEKEDEETELIVFPLCSFLTSAQRAPRITPADRFHCYQCGNIRGEDLCRTTTKDPETAQCTFRHFAANFL